MEFDKLSDIDTRRLLKNTLSQNAYWQINKVLVQTLGLAQAAIMTKLIEWDIYVFSVMSHEERTIYAKSYGGDALNLIKNDYFYLSVTELSKEFNIGIVLCRKTIDYFAQAGWLDKKKTGLPLRNFYKLNKQKIAELLSSKDIESFTNVSNGEDEDDSAIKQVVSIDTTSTMNSSNILIIKDTKNKSISSFTDVKEEIDSRAATERETSDRKTFRRQQHPSEQHTDKALDKKTSRACRKDIACSQDNAAAEIMSRWEQLGLYAIDRKYRSSISADLEKLMSGRFFEHTGLENGYEKYVDRAFTKDEILSAVENRARSATDMNFYPISRTTKDKIRKLPMSMWLYNARAARSHFLQDFEKPPRRAKVKEDLVEDEYPDYTEAIKNAYVDKVLYGVEPITDWTSHEENCFRKSAKLLHQYFEKYADKIKFHNKRTYYQNAELLIKSIRYAADKDDESENVRITPGWLCNPTSFTTRLSQYIGQQRMIKGIYD